jgi:hypothetical protein
MEFKFAELLTKALDNNPQYVTRLPACMLNETEKKYVEFIKECLDAGWVPSLETFKRKFRFIEIVNEIPADFLYTEFSKQRRNHYIAEQLAAYVEKNRQDGLDPYNDLAEFQLKLLDSTVIPNPKIIDYGSLPRELYKTNVYRSKYYVPHMDEISHGLQGGDFVVIMAGTKGYKTTLLKTMTHGAYGPGKENVVFCSQEQAPLAMSQQMDMQELERTHSILRGGIPSDLMEDLLALQKRISKKKNKLFITPVVKSVRQLHEYIVSLNVPVHKVFIDGLNLMQGDFSDSYNSLQKVCAELKSYAIEHNLIIVAVTQSNREGYKSSMNMGAQHIAGSFAIAMFADIMIALSTIEQDGMPAVYVRPILNRHGDLSRKVCMTPYYLPGEKHYCTFGLLPETYDPNEAIISGLEKNVMKSNFKKENGLAWEEVTKKLGEDSADALLGFLAEQDKLDSLHSAVKELEEGAF